MDFEAIYNEASQLKQKLRGLLDSITRLLGVELRYISDDVNWITSGMSDEATEFTITEEQLYNVARQKTSD